MQKTILIIDDDEKLNALLKDYLQKFNFKVQAAAHPRDGLNMIKSAPPDLIILDVMLPDMEGFEVCREIRRQYTIPIIMLTARGEVTDRIVGLELGADDYIPKPFEPRELAARIQAVLRRGLTEARRDIITFGPLRIETGRQRAFLNETALDLTTAEYNILSLLVEKEGHVLDRNRILDEVRGIEWEAFYRSVDVLISRLRQKLHDDPKNPRFIKTVWGSGYMFIGEPDNEK